MTRRTEKTGRNRPPAAGAVGSFSAGTACGYGDAQNLPRYRIKKSASGPAYPQNEKKRFRLPGGEKRRGCTKK